MAWSPSCVRLYTFDYLGFNWQGTRWDLLIEIPYWFPIVLSAVVGYWLPAVLRVVRTAVYRYRLRYSLRALLIATTLLALVLGLTYAVTK
jgi:hypothetical protein